MSDSSTEIQEAKKNFAADDKITLKERLTKKIAGKLSKVEAIQQLYREKDKNIRVEACIHRVPDQLRKVKEDAYRPSVVSIGPFHAEDPNLAPMMQHKLSYMLSFFQQTTKDAEHVIANRDADAADAMECLKDCIDAVDGLDKGIRQCYTEGVKYQEDELAEMMLLDGCFILELFLRFDQNLNYMTPQDYNSDPVLSTWRTAALRNDLALLENQIPYFVLELLYEAIKPHLKISKDKLPDSVASLALKFFLPLSKKEKKEESTGTEFKHLLDLLYQFYFHPTGHSSIDIDENPEKGHHFGPQSECMRGPQSVPAVARKWEVKFCASDLKKSGIEFQAVECNTRQSLLDITFDGNGLISIPQLHFHETANSLLRNLIAFEQCSPKSTQSVTSYVFLFKKLFTTTADSELSGGKKIIIQPNNPTGHDDYFTQLDSMLDKVALKGDFYFGALFHRVDKYCKSWYNLRKLRVLMTVKVQNQVVIFRDRYCSIWKFISLIVAVALLVLTFLQTYFTIRPVK